MPDEPNNQPQNNDTPTPGGGNDDPAPGGNRGFTQDDINRAAGNARREGRQAALNDLLGELGVQNVDELRSGFRQFRQLQEQNQTELERAQGRATTLEEQNQTLRQRLNAERVSREVERQALELGANPQRLSAIVRLREAGDGELDGQGNVVSDAVRASVEAVLESYPEFRSDYVPPRQNVGSGSNPAGGGGNTTEVTPERFAKMDYAERVELYNRDPELYRRLSLGG